MSSLIYPVLGIKNVLCVPKGAQRVTHAPVQVLGALLASLKKLRHLTLWECGFEEAPSAVFSLPALEFLSLEDCYSLTSLDAGTGLTRLTELCLTGCKLTELPRLAGATRLKKLTALQLDLEAGLSLEDLDNLFRNMPSLVDITRGSYTPCL